MKRIVTVCILVLLLALPLLGMAACTDGNATEPSVSDNADNANPTAERPRVQFVFNTGDVITVELYPEQAPITVANFLTYVREGFYRGTVIHRVEPYVVQGGGYVIKNYAYTPISATHAPIKGEFLANGVENYVSHTAGTISMARTNDPDSASSQFFFCPVDYTGWNGYYAAFGHVVDQESLEAIVRMSQVEANNTFPASPLIINSVKVLD